MTFAEELENKLRAAYPALYITAREDWRCIEEVKRVVTNDAQLKMAFHRWTVTTGWDASNKCTDPLDALRFAMTSKGRAAWIFTNFHFHLDNPEVVQVVKEAVQVNKADGRVFILVSNIWKVPAELQDDVTRLEFGLPDRALLLERLDYLLADVEQGKMKGTIDRERVAEAALGMTTWEAENAMALSLVERQTVAPEVVQREKAQAVAKSGLLEFTQPGVAMADVGGLDLLKAWLAQRRDAFSQEARDYGLQEPKGILLVGVPGCGKSLTAKAVAAEWQLPLLRFDMGRVFQGLVGASEENMRRALSVAEAIAPCVMWCDELEKSMAGASGSGATDSGVTARVFGTLISWMQERKRPVFVVATANQVANLPPELLRAGRFDEVFAVDLPSAADRLAILAIHLGKRGRKAKAFDLAAVVGDTDNFSGAELEQVVVKAMYLAFSRREEVATRDLIDAAHATVPLAQTRSEEIAALREWAKTRALPASSAAPSAVGEARPRRLTLA